MPFRRTAPVPDETHRQDPLAVRAAATAMLARRDFASGELRGKLASRGFAEPAIAAAMAALESEGFLNDDRFAQNYVAYHIARGHGPVRIAAELRRFGLQGPVIEATLDAGVDWNTLARKVCRSKFGAQVPTSWANKARQARFLQYRGFSSDHIRAAMGADSDPTEES